VDADRAFFRINAVFCFYVGLNLMGKAFGQWRTGLSANMAYQDLDKYSDLLLRHLAEQSFYFAVFAGYIPAIMLISMMVSFYLYLHERSRSVSLIAFVFGTALGAMWIFERLFGTAMSALASKYVNAPTVAARYDVFSQVKSLYYFGSLGSLLTGHTSLIAYALFGFLFIRGTGLEFAVGSLLMASSVALVVFQFITPSTWLLEAAGILVLPAMAFFLSGVLLWRYRPSLEPWAQQEQYAVVSESDDALLEAPAEDEGETEQ
jgi:hypothetical protein